MRSSLRLVVGLVLAACTTTGDSPQVTQGGGTVFASGEVGDEGRYLSASFVGQLCRYDNSNTFFETKEGVMAYCLGYVTAVAEAYDRGTAKGGWQYCLPKDAELEPEDVRIALLGFLHDNPERNSLTGVSVLAHALKTDYPCPSSQAASDPVRIITDRDIYAKCTALQTEPNAGFCYGYLEGVMEALDNWPTSIGKRFCIKSSWSEYSFVANAFITKKAYLFADLELPTFITASDLMGKRGPAMDAAIHTFSKTFPCLDS